MNPADLISELVKAGIEVPTKCADVEIVLGTTGPPQLKFLCGVSKEDLPKLTTALIAYNKKLEESWSV